MNVMINNSIDRFDMHGMFELSFILLLLVRLNIVIQFSIYLDSARLLSVLAFSIVFFPKCLYMSLNHYFLFLLLICKNTFI